MAGHEDTYEGLGGERNATFSVDRNTEGTTSVGRKAVDRDVADKDVYDERLWMKVANLTGAAGNSTALVGTPEQVAEAMLRTTTSASRPCCSRGSTRWPTRSTLARLREGARLRDGVTAK
jgi:alkanesulfonate monooxygenase